LKESCKVVGQTANLLEGIQGSACLDPSSGKRIEVTGAEDELAGNPLVWQELTSNSPPKSDRVHTDPQGASDDVEITLAHAYKGALPGQAIFRQWK
jgi:hypothetical protein